MKLTPLYVALGAIFFVTPLAFAQSNDDKQGVTQSSDNNEIVFTANRTDQKLDTVGSTINVISEQQLENGQYQRVSDALSTLPGVNIVSNGANGTSNAFIRGINSNNILVMVDGVIVNDPAEGNRGFDFSTLDTLNVERIEVLKGPQSTLYGSSAMGGVIQVFTKKGGPQKTTVTLEGGSYEHVKTTIQTQGQTDTLMYSAALGLNQERGISVADKKLGNTERDRFKNRNGSFYVNYAPLDWINFDLMARYDRQHTDMDNGGGPNQDNLFSYQKSERWLGRFAINTILFDERLLSSLIYDAQKTKRNYFDQGPTSEYSGKSQTITWQNTLNLHKDFQTLFGLVYSKETMKSSSPFAWGNIPTTSKTTKSVYIDQHFNFNDRFFNTIGIRYDNHDYFGDKTTYRLTSRYNINDFIAVKGSYGTGFKAPTLYQLYDKKYGDPTLKPQTSKGYDFGVVITPIDSTVIDITYFHQKIDQNILFTNTFTNKNTKSKGIEISSNTILNEQWSFGLNYTYTNARSYETKGSTTTSKKLARVPKHMIGGHINFKPTEQWNVFAEAKYMSSTQDTYFGPAPTYISEAKTNKAFWLVNVATDYKINDTVSIYGRVNNLLDKHYYTAWGYGQKRINGAIGVKISF